MRIAGERRTHGGMSKFPLSIPNFGSVFVTLSNKTMLGPSATWRKRHFAALSNWALMRSKVSASLYGEPSSFATIFAAISNFEMAESIVRTFDEGSSSGCYDRGTLDKT